MKELARAIQLLAQEPRCQTPDIVYRIARQALEHGNNYGDFGYVTKLMCAVRTLSRKELCDKLISLAEELRSSNPRQLAKHANLRKWILALFKKVEEEEASRFEIALDVLDPGWRERKAAAEENAFFRQQRAARAEEMKPVYADRRSFSTTFAKSGGRVEVQGGAPSLGKRR